MEPSNASLLNLFEFIRDILSQGATSGIEGLALAAFCILMSLLLLIMLFKGVKIKAAIVLFLGVLISVTLILVLFARGIKDFVNRDTPSRPMTSQVSPREQPPTSTPSFSISNVEIVNFQHKCKRIAKASGEPYFAYNVALNTRIEIRIRVNRDGFNRPITGIMTQNSSLFSFENPRWEIREGEIQTSVYFTTTSGNKYGWINIKNDADVPMKPLADTLRVGTGDYPIYLLCDD